MDTVAHCRSLREAGLFTSDLRSTSLRSDDPRYRSDFWCLVYNTHNRTVIAVSITVCFGRQKGSIPTNHTLFQCLHRNTEKIIIKCHYNKICN